MKAGFRWELMKIVRTNLEWKIHQIVIGYVNDDDIADDIAHDIYQMLIGNHYSQKSDEND